MPTLDDPSALRPFADALFAGRPVRLAVVGYTTAPERTHSGWAEAVIAGVINAAGPARVAIVTSPTSREGSIDRIATFAALRRGVPVLHVTCVAFADAARASEIADAAERTAWERVSRFVLPDHARYAEAGAVASTALLVLGGGAQSTTDFACAAQRGHDVFLAIDPGLGAPAWSDTRQLPANAARYLAEQVPAWSADRVAPWPELPCVSRPLRVRWPAQWWARVRVVAHANPEDAARAIAASL